MRIERFEAEEIQAMLKRGIVVGAKSDTKVAMAKTMRRDMTSAEPRLWEHLRRNQCGGLHFRSQQVIDGFIADFYCHSFGFIIEADGSYHQEQSDYDEIRDRIFKARGLRVLRYPSERIINDLSSILAEIRAMIEE